MLFEVMLSQRILALQVLIPRYRSKATLHPLRKASLEYRSLAEQAESELNDLLAWDK